MDGLPGETAYLLQDKIRRVVALLQASKDQKVRQKETDGPQ